MALFVLFLPQTPYIIDGVVIVEFANHILISMSTFTLHANAFNAVHWR